MREIRPIVDEHEKEALSARSHTRYRKSALMYAAFEGELPLSISYFRCEGQTAQFYAVALTDEGEDDPLSALRLALIGALTFALQGGCNRFHFSEEIPKELPESLGLRQTNGRLYAFW